MLWLLDTGKMAKKFGKWRGAVTVASGVGFCILSYLLVQIDDFVNSLAPDLNRPIESSTLTLIAMAIYLIGVLISIWGAWQLYKDATRFTYIDDAERYDREGR